MKKHSLILGMGKSGQSVARHLSRLGQPFAAADTRNDAALLADWQAQYPEVTLSMGALNESILDDVAQIIVSPGIALDIPLIASARARGIPVRGDIDLALHATELPVVLITGSNGKSTVTALVGELLNAVGVSAGVGGNFGTPALDLLTTDAQALVLEVSSFQLESTDFTWFVSRCGHSVEHQSGSPRPSRFTDALRRYQGNRAASGESRRAQS